MGSVQSFRWIEALEIRLCLMSSVGVIIFCIYEFEKYVLILLAIII